MDDKTLKVTCIYNRNGHYHLTQGKEYNVEGFAAKGYMILNDDDEITLYPKSLFEKIIYTSIEIFDEPIGTEFNIRYLDGSLSSEKIKTTLDEGIVWENGEPVEFNKNHVQAVFIKSELLKPVSFMDVVNSAKKCRVEHELLSKCHNINFYGLSEIMNIMASDFESEELKKIIKEGKWFLEP